MPHLQTANKLKQETLTAFERELVTACLLGDGTLSKSGHEYRLRVEQQAAHKEYVEWKYLQLKRLCLSAPKFVAQHQSYRFGTVGHPALTQLRREFYPEGKKSLPERLKLTPLMLAVLFMDDGGRIHQTVSFALHNYSENEIEKIQSSLREFGIRSTLQFDGHHQRKRLYVVSSSYAAFEKLAKPYLREISCMASKLP